MVSDYEAQVSGGVTAWLPIVTLQSHTRMETLMRLMMLKQG